MSTVAAEEATWPLLPPRNTTCGLSAALLTILRTAVLAPATIGSNTNAMEQLLPAPKIPPGRGQLVAEGSTAKSALPAAIL